MKNQFRKCVFIASLLCCGVIAVNARFNVSFTNYGNVANANPIGWTFTGVNMNINTVGPSVGYPNASGGAYMREGSNGPFTNTDGNSIVKSQKGTSTATLQATSLGLTNIRVFFALQRSATYKNRSSYILEWSADGINYTPINFKVVGGNNWNFAKGTGLTLPATADNQTSLFLRWTFVRNGGTRSFVKIDDFKISADSICNPAIIISQPIAPLPTCINTDSIIISVAAAGSVLLTYQWQIDSVDIIDGISYSGTNTAQLIIRNLQDTLNGKMVRCVIINCKGSFIVSTDSVQLAIYTLDSDISKDGVVNNNDFLMLSNKWLQTCIGCDEDITKDGVINVNDFLLLLGDYSKTCQ